MITLREKIKLDIYEQLNRLNYYAIICNTQNTDIIHIK